MHFPRATSFLLAAAGILLAFFAWMTAPGLGGTTDSAHYLATARHLRLGLGLVDVDGLPYRYWGPLFPGLLAAVGSPVGLRVLHGVALLGQLFLWSRVAAPLLPPARSRWLPLLLALSTAVLVPAKFVWAETVFGLLAAGYFFGLLQWLRTGRGAWLVLATAVGFLLPLQRTSGVFLLGGAAVGLLATGAIAGRWGKLLLHGITCTAGFWAWNYYAEALAGPPVYTVLGNGPKLLATLADYGFVLLRWLLPLAAGWRAALPLLGVLALPGLLLGLWPRTDAAISQKPLSISGLRLLWWVVAVDVAAHVAAANLARGAAGLHDTERYLAAVAAPFLVLVLARWPAWPTAPKARWLNQGLLALWLLYSAVRMGHNAHKLRATPVVNWPLAHTDFSKRDATLRASTNQLAYRVPN